VVWPVLLYRPGSANWDVSFFKNIPIRERHQLQLRIEFFNFFNHANFGTPVSVLTNPNVGQILNAGPGRVIQFELKYGEKSRKSRKSRNDGQVCGTCHGQVDIED
jgi:hypothetical protein